MQSMNGTSTGTTVGHPIIPPNGIMAFVTQTLNLVPNAFQFLTQLFSAVQGDGGILERLDFPANGSTAARPTTGHTYSGSGTPPTTIPLQIGQFYFDTTLNAEVYWNGTTWTNCCMSTPPGPPAGIIDGGAPAPLVGNPGIIDGGSA
jgi:hypothetical protein